MIVKRDNPTQAVYRLAYRDRRYHFVPLGNRMVRVERWEPLNGGLKTTRTYTTGKARWLWKELCRMGYRR